MTNDGSKNPLDETKLKEAFRSFSSECDADVDTPSIDYFESLVDEVANRRRAALKETTLFIITASSLLSVILALVRSGFVVPFLVLFGGIAMFSPLLLLKYLPKYMELEG